MTPVTLGRQINGQYELLAGVSEGDSIAADNLAQLTDNMKIPG